MPVKGGHMFVQVIQGRAKDAAGLKKQFDRWQEELKPDSIGYLGTTAGVTEDGQFFAVSRFESQEAAQKNSDRPEQGEWWEETSQYLENPTFTDYTDAQTWMGGGSDDAGFVQAMQGRYKDVQKARELSQQMPEDAMRQHRPDMIGGVEAWKDDGSYTAINYFTSEKEAREGEKKEMPAEMQEGMQEWMSVMDGQPSFVDLKEPWLTSK
jgi:hypothetical protein